METVRIRLVFEERHLLSKAQRKDGMKRSWILLKPHLATVSDFSSYLLDFFLLRDACPDGLILSMDGFVLPPFESTSVMKDKDVVRVKKKEENVTAVDKIDNGPYPSKTAGVVEGQPVNVDVQRLANEELVKDCNNELDEDEPCDPFQLEHTLHAQSDKKTVCRKRKALKTLRSSKTEKNRSAPTAKCLHASSDLQQSLAEHNQSFQQDVILSAKNPGKKHKSSKGHGNADNSNKKNVSKFPKICCLKNDKRKLMGKQVKTHEEKVQQQIVGKSKSADKNNFKDSEQLAGSSDDEEIVPVVIRPGHIRFEPLGQVVANQSAHPAQTSTETLLLNGIISKKRGQKWGKEKSSSWRSNCKNYQGESSTVQVTRDLTTVNCPIDFNKLRPCASLPKRGDIIAYRLIELSSTWTPELSSFRVGKVSWYKPEANKIMLIPVPEHPFVFNKEMNGESTIQVDTSPYGEDGSLKADYSSLIDIRIVKHGNSNFFEAAADNISQVSHTNQSWDKWENHATARVSENGNENAWDEILLALKAKKTELSKEVGWSRVEKKVQERAHGS